MSDSGDDERPIPHGQGLSPVEALSTQLGKLPVFRKLQQGGTVRIPPINPLVVLVVVAALIFGSVLGIRALIDNANSDDRCREIDRSFDLFATPPPPILSEVPEALRGTTIEASVITSTTSMREAWNRLAYAPRPPNSNGSNWEIENLESSWISWVESNRVKVLVEEGC